jgi:hypothetical protein
MCELCVWEIKTERLRLPSDKQEARAILLLKIREMLARIDEMSDEEWGVWVDALSPAEFVVWIGMSVEEIVRT